MIRTIKLGTVILLFTLIGLTYQGCGQGFQSGETITLSSENGDLDNPEKNGGAYSVNYNDPAQYLNTYGKSGFCFPYSYRFDQIVRAGTTGSSFRIELHGDDKNNLNCSVRLENVPEGFTCPTGNYNDCKSRSQIRYAEDSPLGKVYRDDERTFSSKLYFPNDGNSDSWASSNRVNIAQLIAGGRIEKCLQTDSYANCVQKMEDFYSKNGSKTFYESGDNATPEIFVMLGNNGRLDVSVYVTEENCDGTQGNYQAECLVGKSGLTFLNQKDSAGKPIPVKMVQNKWYNLVIQTLRTPDPTKGYIKIYLDTDGVLNSNDLVFDRKGSSAIAHFAKSTMMNGLYFGPEVRTGFRYIMNVDDVKISSP